VDDLTSTASPLEVVWTIVCLVGLIVAARNCWNARQDLKRLLASGRNGILLREQRAALTTHTIIAISLLCKVLIGILAMLSLQSTDPDGGASLAAMYAPVLMVLSALGLIYLSIMLNRNRRITLEEIRDRYAIDDHS
jgi:hypothetical protein